MRRAGALAGAALLLLVALPSVANAFGPLPGSEGFAVSAETAGGEPATHAGTHPDSLNVHLALAGGGALRDLRLHLPPGLLINPTAVNECSATAFHTPRSSPFEASASGENCPNSTQVGVAAVKVGGTLRHFGLFNLVPPVGTAAAIGMSPFGTPLIATSQLRESDSGLDLDLGDVPEGFALESLDLTIWGTPWQLTHDGERGNCLDEQSGGSWGSCLSLGGASAPENHWHSYFTLPTTPCGAPLAYTAELRSWAGEDAEAATTSPALTFCNKALSSLKVQLMSAAASARTGLAVNVDVNDGGGITNPGGTARPALKTATVALPSALTLNPSLAAGLGACSEAEFARETATSEPGAGCPNSSKIGTVSLEGVLGLSETLTGGVYLATPRDNPFGSLFALYLLARNPRRGLIVKSRGRLEPNPTTGALEASFENLPRLLYTHLSLDLREGQRSVFISPPLCGSYEASMRSASWAEPEVFGTETSTFFITSGEDGGPCPTGGAPPFHPTVVAGSLSLRPGSYAPFYLRIARGDSEAEINSYAVTLPAGLLASIAGIPPCPEAAIAAAAGRSATEQAQSPSCPAATRIGHTIAGFGVGGTLAWAPGDLYLAGPYQGAPLSVVAIDSAMIGPFDLGTIIVRQAVRIDPRTAQVRVDPVGSQPIPHILAGVPLHLRDIRVYVDRPNFTVNPTSCDPTQISSHIGSAGLDPFDPADDSGYDASQRFQVIGCSALGFRPTLSLRLRGATRHGGFPSLRATYKPRPGANLRAVSVALPPSLFLAQGHIRGVCTRAQFSAAACPRSSVYGTARAKTPLLEEPLEGPVYLRSSRNAVPDLVADLRGRGIEIEVPARIDSFRAGIRASFESLPDAPVTSFTMTLGAGKRSLLQNGSDLCAAAKRGARRSGQALFANARFIAHSNATAVLHPKLGVRCKHHDGKAKASR